ncbi:MAG: hypothetical protein ACRCXT_14555 [Paraclostridium sp.]
MKNIYNKKFIALSLMTAITFPMFTQSANALAPNLISVNHNLSSSLIKNQDALSYYNNLISKQTKSKIMSITRNEDNMLKGDFEALNYVGNKDSDFDVLYDKGTKDLHNIITFNKDTNTYSMIEVDTNSEYLTYMVNDQKYKIALEGENINIISENGNILPLSVTEYEDEPLVKPTFSSITQTYENDKEVRRSYGKEHGPFKRTNKTIVDVLGSVGFISGLAATKIKHPVLGAIAVITSSISYVGNIAYSTLYIQYYQAFATDGSSHVKQRDRYYRLNNYTSFVKERTWYFYSSRP